MDLIDEKYDALVLDGLVYDILDPLFKFAPVFRTGDHSGEIESHYPLSGYCIRNHPCLYVLGKSLYNGSLSDSGLSYEAGVVLSTP